MKTPLNKSLKHLLYFSLIVFTLSCSKESSNTTPSTPSIVGKWSLVSRTLDNIPFEICEVGIIVTFNFNNTWSHVKDCIPETTNGTYIINGSSISITLESSPPEIKPTMSFTVTETTLTFTQVTPDKIVEIYKRVI